MGNRSSSSSSSSPSCSPHSGRSLSCLLASHRVFIFSSTSCAYCKVAKRTLDELGTSYTTAEVNRMPAAAGARLSEEVRDATGQSTVPQVFICGRWVGGCQETRRLRATGELEEMIRKCCDGDITCRGSGRKH